MNLKLLLEIITAIGSIGAITISVFAIKYAIKNTNKQVTVDKIEEVYELLLLMLYYYNTLKFLFEYLKDAKDIDNLDANQRKLAKEEYLKYLEILKQRVDLDELYKKIARIKVLTDCYVEKNIKKEILTLTDFFEKLMLVVLQEQYFIKEMFYNEGFPDYKKLYDFFESIKPKIINKIGITEFLVSQDEINKYRETEFKKKLGLK